MEMPVKTGRTCDPVTITVNRETCTVCGLCTNVCKSGPLYMEHGGLKADPGRGLGCIACGQCMMVCPSGSITVSGRCLSGDDIRELPPQESRTAYEQLSSLMLSRRSVRNFRSREIEQADIRKIIDAASTAPMGIPPSEVELLVLNGAEKMAAFTEDIMRLIERSSRVLSRPVLSVLRPFMKKETFEQMVSFIVPLMNELKQGWNEGTDLLFYNAPLGIYFHTSPYAEKSDSVIAATYAMLAAESLGLGSCMIGTVAPLLTRAKDIKEKYGIPVRNNQGIMVIFGYPAVRYKRAVRRDFAAVKGLK